MRRCLELSLARFVHTAMHVVNISDMVELGCVSGGNLACSACGKTFRTSSRDTNTSRSQPAFSLPVEAQSVGSSNSI